ncbi:hypothetical protein [Abyssogena phaseoliformis symbiont]|uniref:hypothetical protein n=1 Tax=Abyssogena phaseoliformis symbiont TaxID=596095 RepID=UPI001916506F|nr:hypothetical protein [Abyssogena phaseoliformis symbiont]MBW5289447.1 hypothetical protein [Candidatus Ruthia sp. Apha_13_S6]
MVTVGFGALAKGITWADEKLPWLTTTIVSLGVGVLKVSIVAIKAAEVSLVTCHT